MPLLHQKARQRSLGLPLGRGFRLSGLLGVRRYPWRMSNFFLITAIVFVAIGVRSLWFGCFPGRSTVARMLGDTWASSQRVAILVATGYLYRRDAAAWMALAGIAAVLAWLLR